MNTLTTTTMTQPTLQHPWTPDEWSAHSVHPDVVAMREFESANHCYTKAPSIRCTSLSMDKAFVALTPDFILYNATITTVSDDKKTTTKTFTLHKMWAVFAPRLADGKLLCAIALGAHTENFFNTEAEAIKHMKKTTKAAAKWHAAEALRNQYAAEARMACRFDGNTAPHASTIDPNNAIGAMVRIHQMGKFRTGVIVDQTPTKYIVVYTTPSNTDEIRTSTIGKDGSK